MAKKEELQEFNGKKGVWRTIGGRKVFIASGQSLGEAMKKSGKFDNIRSKNVERKEKKEVEDIPGFEGTLDKLDEIQKQAKDIKEKYGEKKEITEQGNSNRKEVREAIQSHIKEYYEEEENWEQNFIHDMENQKYGNNVTPWQWGKNLAENGTFLIYDDDISEFLDSLKINPKGKKFNSQKTFETYTNLIGRESARLYEKIKNKK